MPPVLVVSQHARVYGELIEAAALPAIDGRCCETAEEAREYCASAEILFGAPDRIAPLLDDCASLRWVQSSWAGIKPLADCERRDYRLTGVKDIFGALMVEYVIGWLLAFERNILVRARADHWDDTPDPGLGGKRIGILGTGSIGKQVAAACKLFGLETRGLNSDGRIRPGFDRCFASAERIPFARGLDYLVALLPDTPASDRLIDAELLAQLAPGAILINGGRGNCLVQADLLAALASGQLRQAVLDVLPREPLPATDPLWKVPNLTITSHTAAPTHPAAIVGVFCENYRRYLAGDDLLYPIDLDKGY